MLVYMDDLRVIEQTLELAWVATRGSLSRLQHQGSHDNPRKGEETMTLGRDESMLQTIG